MEKLKNSDFFVLDFGFFSYTSADVEVLCAVLVFMVQSFGA